MDRFQVELAISDNLLPKIKPIVDELVNLRGFDRERAERWAVLLITEQLIDKPYSTVELIVHVFGEHIANAEASKLKLLANKMCELGRFLSVLKLLERAGDRYNLDIRGYVKSITNAYYAQDKRD